MPKLNYSNRHPEVEVSTEGSHACLPCLPAGRRQGRNVSSNKLRDSSIRQLAVSE